MGTIRRLPCLAFLWLAVAGPPSRLHALDCDRNGVEDAVEIEDGRSLDCNRNGVPDACEVLPGVALSGARIAYNAGDRPRFPRPGDFDGDGDVDLAVMNSRGISVLLNAGDASFPERRIVSLGFRLLGLVSGDLDGDGDPDLVVTGGSVLALLLNEGNADFAPPLLFPGPTHPSSLASSLALGDLDGDGDPDLAVGDSRAKALVVFENDGGMNLTELGRHAAGGAPRALEAADLDGDGDVDLVLGRIGGLFLLENRGDATFEPPVQLGASRFPSSLRAADLDRDGDLDLAAADREGAVTVFLRGPSGEYSPRSFPLSGAPSSLEVADLDRDGDLDLLVANGTSSLDLLLNRGDGVFLRRGHRSSTISSFVAAEDLDGDGDADVAVTHEDVPRLDVLLNTGSATFLLPEPNVGFSTLGDPRWLEVADLDGDGDLDLAVAGSRGVELFLGDGTGAILPGPRFLDASVSSVVAVDLDGDGKPDLVASTRRRLMVLHNQGELRLRATSLDLDGADFTFVTAADVDGDDSPDLIAADHNRDSLAVFHNRGDGEFSLPRLFPAVDSPVFIAAADLDGDRDVDLATSHRRLPGITFLWNDGTGTFGPPDTHPTATPLPQLALADLDGDGRTDIAAPDGVGRLHVFFNAGGGRFERRVLELPGAPRAVAAADLDRDGDPDLVIARPALELVTVLLNAGDRSFDEPLDFLAEDPAVALVAADLDDDGRPDVAAGITGRPPRVAVLRTDHACSAPVFQRGDANADGELNIADAITILNHLFLGGEDPPCRKSADVDDEGQLSLTDAVIPLSFLFLGGRPPKAPFPHCGIDPTDDALDCREFPPCT